MAVKKTTKKFVKKHLKHTVEHRKEVQNFKKRKDAKKNKKRLYEEGEGNKVNSKTIDKSIIYENDIPVDELMTDSLPKSSKKDSKDENLSDLEESEELEEGSDSNDSDDEIDAESHKKDLDNLMENDPEFYKYLQANDKSLLEFNPEEIDNQDDIDSDSEDSDNDRSILKEDKKSEVVLAEELDLDTVSKWLVSLKEEHSLNTLKKVISAFRACVNTTEGGNEEYKYSITDPKVYDKLMVISLKYIPEVLHKHFPLNKKGALTVSLENKRLKSLNPAIKAHGTSLMLLLESMQDVTLIPVILSALSEVLPYLLSFRKLVREIIKSVIDVWTNSSNESVQLAAYTVIRKFAKEQSSLLEPILKSSYSGLIKRSRVSNMHTIPTINFLKNSAAELFLIKPEVSYQVAFDFIRQMAIHLRSSMNNKNKDSYKVVYNWQFAHSLDFWSRVLSLSPDISKGSASENSLQPLIYPVVQITLGTSTLIPTAQYFPLRFFLVRSLIRLSRHTGVYIPLVPVLSSVLSSSLFTKKPKPSTLRPLDFEFTIRASSSYLGTRVYHDGVAEQVVELLGEFFVLYAKNVAFPELSIPITVSLRKYIKNAKDSKINGIVRSLITAMKDNSTYIMQKRLEINFTPTDTTQITNFLSSEKWETTPLGKFVANKRLIQEEQLKLLRASQNEEENDEDVLKHESNNDSDIDIDDDEDEEVEGEKEESEKEIKVSKKSNISNPKKSKAFNKKSTRASSKRKHR